MNATQVTFGFDRAHPKVWDFFRSEGLVVVSCAPSSHCRLKFLEAGHKVIAYIPKSQGGFGVVGLGSITGAGTIFEKGGNFEDDAVGKKYKAHMRKVYTDISNKPAKTAARCFNVQFKKHKESLAKRKSGKNVSPWAWGVEHWSSEMAWKTKRSSKDAFMIRFPVKWEATVPFEKGLLSLDWPSLGLSSFKFSALSSVCPRKLTTAHWDFMRSALEERATPNGTIPIAPSALKRKRSKAECSSQAQTLGSWQSLEQLLESCGLSKYAKCFQDEEVDLESLNLLSDQDLKSLGLPLGPRRKLQSAMASVLRPPVK